MFELRKTGGARIGHFNATWPFAILTVNKDYLEINAGLIGNLIFRPSDVISIKPYSVLFSSGIRIIHKVENYNNLVVFSSLDNHSELLKEIKQTGFLEDIIRMSDNESKIVSFQEQGAFPIKKAAFIAIVLIWNIFILYDFIPFILNGEKEPIFGIGLMIALCFILLTSVLLLISEPIRFLILKEGRTIAHINRFLFFLMFVCSILFFVTILT